MTDTENRTLKDECKGFSMYMSIGKYAGFNLYRDGPAYKLLLGYVAFVIVWLDIDEVVSVLHYLSKQNDETSES